MKSDQHTCLAATFEVPTTLPLLSRTLMPSDSSECLISTTLQTFAVATERWEGFLTSGVSSSLNWQMLFSKKEQLFFTLPNLERASTQAAILNGCWSRKFGSLLKGTVEGTVWFWTVRLTEVEFSACKFRVCGRKKNCYCNTVRTL